MRAVYNKGQTAPDLLVVWTENNAPVDVSSGWTISLSVFPFGGTTLFTKTAGITALVPAVVTDPSLDIAWAGELDALASGTYVGQVVATKPSNQDQTMFFELVIRENAPNDGYCEVDDLLLGDMLLSPDFNKYTFVNSAADEIDSRIGFIYTLPLNRAALAITSEKILKNINSRLASGRLILAIATGGEQTALHAYGQSLVQEAFAELQLVLTGALPLDGATRIDGGEGPGAPTTFNADSVSSIDTFYEEFFGFHTPRFPPFPWFRGVWLPNDNKQQ